MVPPMELRKEVRAFAELMETQLRKHDRKRGTSWKNCSAEFLTGRMFDEIGEVVEEIDPGDTIGKYLVARLREHFDEDHPPRVQPKHPDKLCLELADVANLAMMLADVTHEDFCDDEKEDKIECALDRSQWNDILCLRGVIVGSVGQKALLDLGHALDASWNPDDWPDRLD